MSDTAHGADTSADLHVQVEEAEGGLSRGRGAAVNLGENGVDYLAQLYDPPSEAEDVAKKVGALMLGTRLSLEGSGKDLAEAMGEANDALASGIAEVVGQDAQSGDGIDATARGI